MLLPNGHTNVADLEEYIEWLRAQEPPQYYYGNLIDLMEAGWRAAGIGHHRDSDVLNESNWHVVSRDLLKRFPDQFQTNNASHWAVGWVETLLVKLPTSPRNRKAYVALQAAYDWFERIDNNSYADEEDYYRREYKDFQDSIDSWMRDDMKDLILDKIRAGELLEAQVLFDFTWPDEWQADYDNDEITLTEEGKEWVDGLCHRLCSNYGEAHIGDHWQREYEDEMRCMPIAASVPVDPDAPVQLALGV